MRCSAARAAASSCSMGVGALAPSQEHRGQFDWQQCTHCGTVTAPRSQPCSSAALVTVVARVQQRHGGTTLDPIEREDQRCKVQEVGAGHSLEQYVVAPEVSIALRTLTAEAHRPGCQWRPRGPGRCRLAQKGAAPGTKRCSSHGAHINDRRTDDCAGSATLASAQEGARK